MSQIEAVVLLRRKSGPMNELVGEWRQLHNEEFHNIYSSPNIVTMIL
jgi:hypothetical protein